MKRFIKDESQVSENDEGDPRTGILRMVKITTTIEIYFKFNF